MIRSSRSGGCPGETEASPRGTELLFQAPSHERNTRSGYLLAERRGRQRARFVHDPLTLALEPATDNEDGGVRACSPFHDFRERGSGSRAARLREPRQHTHITGDRPGLDRKTVRLGAERHPIGEEHPQSLLLPGDAVSGIGGKHAHPAQSPLGGLLCIGTRSPGVLRLEECSLGLLNLSPGLGSTSLRSGHSVLGLADLPRQPRNRESNALSPGPHVVDPAEQRTRLLDPHGDTGVTLLELARVGDELA